MSGTKRVYGLNEKTISSSLNRRKHGLSVRSPIHITRKF